ncbi:Uncharacterized protein BM_BM17769 [Brugia malayi]|uniref:Uncharacterized protein n=1 Tax=Brugia malayi TaxID=6279 RepID=A0A4E9FW23_BRUMA|nr:Uncharacterized protein BM_BM17769 [Brugia malayi]VIO98833.1 Uncharacterized protein BM_BM17769 [Brugia malayi]
MQNTFPNLNGASMTLSMHDIETNDEMEDQILFERAATMLNSSAYFRSRLNLVPQRHNITEDDKKEEEKDDEEICTVHTKFTEGPQIYTERFRHENNHGTKECHEQYRISLCNKSCNSSNTS